MSKITLNPKQAEAVSHLKGPLLIVAGAGSGKTRTMTARIAKLIDEGVKPWAILALTFTNKAAREMKERVIKQVGAVGEDCWIGTFHSVCVRILRRDIDKLGYNSSFAIYDDDDQLRVCKEIYRVKGFDPDEYPFKEVRNIISDAKNKLMGPDEWFAQSAKLLRHQTFHEIFVDYEKRLKEASALDFDDLILKALQLLVDHPPVLDYYRKRFEYVHVDEYQDTNQAQYELVRLLTHEHRNLCVVGDDDQSIYSWRGADIRNIREFKKDFPDAVVIKLEQNYRSTKTILDAANAVISHNDSRMDKALWTEGEQGEKVVFYAAADEREEAAWVCERIRNRKAQGAKYNEIAILYRVNALSRVMEDMLMRSAIPYRVYGGTRFFDRKEIKDIVAYMRAIHNPMDEVAIKRIINVPKRAIGEATVATLENHAETNGISFYEAIKEPPEALASRPRKCVEAFDTLMTDLKKASETLPLSEFAEKLINDSGLLAQYSASADDEIVSRRENTLEFLTAAAEFENENPENTLAAFLEHVALVTDLDRTVDAPDCVSLMTLHSAKGLEFDLVFMLGLEQGLFPSRRAMDEDDRLEEERRLCYVGMTRARKVLFMTMARRRMLFNQQSFSQPSQFLDEIPDELISDEWGRMMTKHFGSHEERDAKRAARAVRAEPDLSMPVMGDSLLDIAGIQKGFGVSAKVQKKIEKYNVGDRVVHRTFGEGRVLELSGTGSSAVIVIHFTAYGEKQFLLSMAPLARRE